MKYLNMLKLKKKKKVILNSKADLYISDQS